MSDVESGKSGSTNANGGSRFKKFLAYLFAFCALAGIAVGITYAVKPEIFQQSESSNGNVDANSGLINDSNRSKLPKTNVVSETPMASPTTEPTSEFVSGSGVPQEKSETVFAEAEKVPPTLESRNPVVTKLNRFVKQTVIMEVAHSSCTASDGDELADMMEGDACKLVTLLPSTIYRLPREVEVSGHKAIIGHPIKLPAIDATANRRGFTVEYGGSLSLKFLRMWRGSGEGVEVGKLTVPVLRGGSVFVNKGSFFAFGVLFTVRPPWGVPKEEEGRRNLQDIVANIVGVNIFGGQVYVGGGVANLMNCHFLNWGQVGFWPALRVYGGDILLGGGVLVANACTFVRVHDIVNALVVGVYTNVMVGAAVFNGCIWSLNVGAIQANGAGIFHFTGAGVAVFNGAIFNANLGVVDFFGAGLFQFLGAGAHVFNGVIKSANLGAVISAGAGTINFTGAGAVVYNGGIIQVSAGSSFLAGSGFGTYLGTGSLVMTGMLYTVTSGTIAAYGAGLIFNGSGLLVLAGSVITQVFGAAISAMAGFTFFMGAGESVFVGIVHNVAVGAGFLKLSGVILFQGAGQAIFVGYQLNPNVFGDAVYFGPGNMFPILTVFGAGSCTGLSLGTSCGRRLEEGLVETSARAFFSEYTAMVSENTPMIQPMGFADGVCPAANSIRSCGATNLGAIQIPAGCANTIQDDTTCTPMTNEEFINYGGKSASMVVGLLPSGQGISDIKVQDIATFKPLAKDQYVVSGVITTTCTTGETCATTADVAAALINLGMSPYAAVSVGSRMNALNTLKSIAQSEYRASDTDESTATCGSIVTSYEVTLPTSAKLDSETLASILNNPEALMEELATFTPGLCSTSSTLETNLMIPTDGTVETNIDMVTSPSVVIITDASRSTVFTDLRNGETHQFLFSDFPVGDKVDVALMIPNDGETFDQVMKLATVPVNDLNQASYFWKIEDVAPGTYYIKATSESSPSIYAFSTAFSVNN